jgi:hypothetical protein
MEPETPRANQIVPGYRNPKGLGDYSTGHENGKTGPFPFGLDGFGDQPEHTSRAQRSFRNNNTVAEPSGENGKLIAELITSDLAAQEQSDKYFDETPDSEMQKTQRELLSKEESSVKETNPQSNQDNKQKRGLLAKELSSLLPPPHQPSMQADNSLGSSFMYETRSSRRSRATRKFYPN